MTYRVFDDYLQLREFIQAGKAKITIKSKKTGQHFTYQIQSSRDGRWFVRTLTSGEDPWLYLGVIWSNRRFGTTKASPHNARELPAYKAFDWLWTHELCYKFRIHDSLEVYHEGECGMCGGPLTNPESIERGYGPECWKKRIRMGYKE